MIRRGSIVVAAIVAVIAAGSIGTAARQTPQRDPRAGAPVPAAATPSPTGTGSIAGVVTNDDGSRPVRSAYMLLIGIRTGLAKVSSTDTDGKFLFTNLPADRYLVGASKPPFLGTIAGARRPGHAGTPIVLADAQKITNIAIRMPMGAAITGVITDEKGQPSPNTQVGVYQWRMQNGERTPVSVGSSATTDERGRYRVYGLTPGDYLVAVYRGSPPPAGQILSAGEVDAAIRSGSAAPVPPAPALRYAPGYFPGTSRPIEAMTVTVAAGEERGNVDVKLEVTQPVRIEGSVAASDGQLPQRLAVTMMTKGPNLVQSVYSVQTQPDGSFAIPNVMPGTYVLRANGGGQPPQVAMATIEVAGPNVGGVQLVLRPGFVLSGALVFRGRAAAPAMAGWRVPVRMIGAGGVPAPNVQPSAETGSFAINNMFPGAYVFGAPQPGAATSEAVTWTLESVVVDGRDVTDVPVDIGGDSTPKNVIVTLTDRVQELSGRITHSNGTPSSEHTIVVFPEDKAYWVFGSRRIVTARPGTDGSFTLSGAGPTSLPPGRYLMAAVTDIDRDEQFDPGFLASLVPASVSVVLQPGEKKVQDLVIK